MNVISFCNGTCLFLTNGTGAGHLDSAKAYLSVSVVTEVKQANEQEVDCEQSGLPVTFKARVKRVWVSVLAIITK